MLQWLPKEIDMPSYNFDKMLARNSALDMGEASALGLVSAKEVAIQHFNTPPIYSNASAIIDFWIEGKVSTGTGAVSCLMDYKLLDIA